MKKIILILGILCCCFSTRGQVKYSLWTGEMALCYGMDYCSSFTGNTKVLNTKLPSELLMTSGNLFNIFFSVGEDMEYTGINVLGYPAFVKTSCWKIGFSVGKLYFGDSFSIGLSPYYYELYSGTYDTSHNRIGWEEIGIPVCPDTSGVGLSLQMNMCFNYWGFKLCSDFSKYEYSFSIGLVVDFTSLLLFD